MDLLRMNWDATIAYCEKLAGMVKGFKPDMIVGLSRGGLVPARILADILGVDDIGILGISFYKTMGKPTDFPRISQELNMDIKGKRILIVDDIVDTGKSILVAKDYLKRKGAGETRVATIHYKPTPDFSDFKPDYYAATASAWIVYPWERHEIERKLKKKR
ncbi:phosphoribosyltransferase [Candidatus Micrarchaeota archaeon]|nr:phosphoribosyltransferase [Candidatus Micrarchaeota archaeon]